MADPDDVTTYGTQGTAGVNSGRLTGGGLLGLDWLLG